MGILLGRMIFFLILMYSWSLYLNLKQLFPARQSLALDCLIMLISLYEVYQWESCQAG